MKSPFVRFSRFVRTGLSFATIGLCLLSGCRHVPGSRHACEDRAECAPGVAMDNTVRGLPGYEESSLERPISPDAAEPPLVSLSEGDTFELAPRETPEPISPAPLIANQPAATVATEPEPSPVAEPLEVQKSVEAEDAPKPSAEPAASVHELLDSDFDRVRPKKPAPAPKELIDEFLPEQPAASPNLEIPPEPAQPTDQDSQPVAEPKVQAATKASIPVVDNEVVSLDSYCAGLVFDSQGFGYVSHRNQIVRFSPTGETSVWTTLSSPKGHRIEPEGTHLVCDTERRAVLRMSFDGKVVGVAAKDCEGSALRSPYDVAVDPKGGFYFTDPGYVQIKNPIGKLHYVDSNGQVSVVVAKLGYPTGIAFDAERQRLLVAESLSNRILQFRITEPGKIDSHEVLVQLSKSPDAEFHLANLCLDAAGNLYVTQPRTKTIHVFDPLGRPIGRFSTGAVAPSSIALRSRDATELFLTGEFESQTRNGKVLRLDLGQ